jgi:DNA-binding transcriptional ArsR family regulator
MAETATFDRDRVLAVFKALSNENRIAIFEHIRIGQASGEMDVDGQLTICGVAGNFNLSLSVISHHIKELRRAGLVHCQRHGKNVH